MKLGYAQFWKPSKNVKHPKSGANLFDLRSCEEPFAEFRVEESWIILAIQASLKLQRHKGWWKVNLNHHQWRLINNLLCGLTFDELNPYKIGWSNRAFSSLGTSPIVIPVWFALPKHLQVKPETLFLHTPLKVFCKQWHCNYVYIQMKLMKIQDQHWPLPPNI